MKMQALYNFRSIENRKVLAKRLIGISDLLLWIEMLFNFPTTIAAEATPPRIFHISLYAAACIKCCRRLFHCSKDIFINHLVQVREIFVIHNACAPQAVERRAAIN